MDIETLGLGAGSYPEPPEEKTKIIKGKLYLIYKFEMEVPEKWEIDDIADDIYKNTDEYMQVLDDIDYDI